MPHASTPSEFRMQSQCFLKSTSQLKRRQRNFTRIPAGGLAQEGSGWIAAPPRFILPVRVLSRVVHGSGADTLQPEPQDLS
jgi:hypothetical protein